MKVVVGTFNKEKALGTVKLCEGSWTALGDTVPSPAAAAVKFNDRRRVTALHCTGGTTTSHAATSLMAAV